MFRFATKNLITEGNIPSSEQSKFAEEEFTIAKVRVVKFFAVTIILMNAIALYYIKEKTNLFFFVPAGLGLIILIFARYFSKRFES